MSYSDNAITFNHISLVCHADWSKNPDKRWMAVALKRSDNGWTVSQLSQVSVVSDFFLSLKSCLPEPGCILAGFDFPIGLPRHYAEKVGVVDFIPTLRLLGHQQWAQFYEPAEIPEQINIYRPFYPLKPGGSKRVHLERGLDLRFNQLHRLCEVSHINRRAACPLFWTLGGQQVGKAAIHGWRSLISPALDDSQLNLCIWPFSGRFNYLCKPGNIVVVETYPAEFYAQLGFFPPNRKMSKRRYTDRKYYAQRLISLAVVLKLHLDSFLLASILDGFGDGPQAEDQFDALIGLYGMMNVVQGNHPTGEPVPSGISNIEGWIFGQEQPKKEVLIAS